MAFITDGGINDFTVDNDLNQLGRRINRNKMFVLPKQNSRSTSMEEFF